MTWGLHARLLCFLGIEQHQESFYIDIDLFV